MQLTLDDLRKSNDPLADLLKMSDSDLDRMAAEAHGWEYGHSFPAGPEFPVEVLFDADGSIYPDEYEPSRDLNQAYELLDSGDRRNRYVWACDVDGDGRYVELISSRLGVVQVYFEQAGSHARAVCALAILGLLQGKDGAA